MAGIAVVGGAVALLYRLVRPARAIWQGDASKVPPTHQRIVAAGPRTYPSFLLCAAAFAIGCASGGVGIALAGLTGALLSGWPTTLVVAGLLLWLSNIVLVPLNWFVDATNRPKFLVPPPYRDQPGAILAARSRHKRKRAGLPETDHRVEIFEMRPGPDDDFDPYFVAALHRQ